MASSIINAARLRELLDYNPATGAFTRRVSVLNGRWPPGRPVGGLSSQGYIAICIDKVKYRAHRLAFLWMTGEWPADEVDHIDCNRANNSWSNLRVVSKSINMQNRRQPTEGCSSGYLGVCRSTSGKSWRATIAAEGKCHHLGTYDTPEEAHQVYLEAKRRLHPGCTI